MKLFKEHVEYLKDNPEGYWFKRKLYGWGWTPATRAGWLVLLLYMTFMIGFAVYFGNSEMINETPKQFIIPVILATVLLLVICWRKGEPPKWQWGKENTEKK